MTNDHASVARHYGSTALAARIQAGLVTSGLDPASLTTADLAPLDQFHTGGAGATRELAQVAGVQPGMRVLDLGGGIGGPARTLASEFGCDVTVLDLTDEFCRAGEMLTASTALSAHVHFHVGDATHPPFDPASFDVVWTQHATMNIADKPALYRSATRLLRPGGTLVMHEITAGERKPVYFPVPWAPDDRISHLLDPDALRRTIEDAGFVARTWQDATPQAIEWFRTRLGSAPSTPPPLGLHLLLGTAFRESFQNLLRNLEEDRVRVVVASFAKNAK